MKKTYNTSEPTEVKEKKTQTQLKLEREQAELEELLSDKKFRDWVWRILSYTKIFNTHAHLEPHDMAVAAGKRDVGLRIFGDLLKASPEAYTIMVKENDNG